MRERERCDPAITATEAMCNLLELENHQSNVNLDQMMTRLRDLSAYSLTHAEIIDPLGGW